jgi:hypothetical protein
MKRHLFYTILAVFIVTSVVTLLGVTGVIHISDGYLTALLSAFLVQSAGAVLAVFKRADFFSEDTRSIIGGVNFNPPDSQVNTLSEKAKTLLKAVSQDPSGFLTLMEQDAVTTIETNGKNFVENGSPKSRAEWEAVVEELTQFYPELLALSYSSEGIRRLKITDKGYEIADSL